MRSQGVGGRVGFAFFVSSGAVRGMSVGGFSRSVERDDVLCAGFVEKCRCAAGRQCYVCGARGEFIPVDLYANPTLVGSKARSILAVHPLSTVTDGTGKNMVPSLVFDDIVLVVACSYLLGR